MNEADFIKQWDSEKHIYEAWGEYILGSICKSLKAKGKDLDVFLKIPPTCRLKEDSSLVDKAFYRPGKNYTDPYSQIEDKVGARFVVLLLDHIKEICEIIQSNDTWVADACKHFDEDKEKDPLLFTYQSVHFILRPKEGIIADGVTIPATTACELQVRTLLQHAHAELTHDAIYKAKRTIQPKVHRTVAKSMALIETTDDFFSSVTEQLNYGPLQEYGVIDRLDGLYLSLTEIKSHAQKSSIVVWDTYERFVDDSLFESIQDMFNNSIYSGLTDTVKNRYSENVFYQQSIVLFIYWMLVNKKKRLLEDWPFNRELLEPLAVDLGVSTWGE